MFLASYVNDEYDGLEPISRGREATGSMSKCGLCAVVVVEELKPCHSPNIILVTWVIQWQWNIH